MEQKLYDEIHGQMTGYWAGDYTTIDRIADKHGLDRKTTANEFYKKLNKKCQ